MRHGLEDGRRPSGLACADFVTARAGGRVRNRQKATTVHVSGRGRGREADIHRGTVERVSPFRAICCVIAQENGCDEAVRWHGSRLRWETDRKMLAIVSTATGQKVDA